MAKRRPERPRPACDDPRGRRSDCPLSLGLELFGDRWTLLILRDVLFFGRRTFKEFQEAGEGIASNVLADRLRRLVDSGILRSDRSSADARVVEYRPTEKGLDLLPVLIEIILWTARHERTAAPPAIIERMTRERDAFIREVRAKWVAGE